MEERASYLLPTAAKQNKSLTVKDSKCIFILIRFLRRHTLSTTPWMLVDPRRFYIALHPIQATHNIEPLRANRGPLIGTDCLS